MRKPFAMSDKITVRREAFRRWIKENGGVTAIMKKADVPRSTIYSYLDGSSDSLKGTTQDKIAEAFGIGADEMFGGSATSVPVVGYVQAGAEAVLFAAGQGPFDYVPAPKGSTDNTVAVEIRGESLGSMLTGWLVYYDDVRSPITPDLHYQICVVGLQDGRILVKKLLPGQTPGVYHLESTTEGVLLNQEPIWAAKVKGMSPR